MALPRNFYSSQMQAKSTNRARIACHKRAGDVRAAIDLLASTWMNLVLTLHLPKQFDFYLRQQYLGQIQILCQPKLVRGQVLSRPLLHKPKV